MLILDHGKGNTKAKPICRADKKTITSRANKNRNIKRIIYSVSIKTEAMVTLSKPAKGFITAFWNG